MSIKHVISVSGGKDSAATLLLALERFNPANIVPIFCDTGNEHQAVYEYLDYLETALDVRIHRLKASFDTEIASKREFVARDVRHRREYDTKPVFAADGKTPVWRRDGRGNIVLNKKGRAVQKTVKVGSGRRVRWTNSAKRRALEVLHPTGNPFLDLCLWKGLFPSRKAQFCTEELKRNIAVSFQLDLIDAGHTVVSWQGVRRDESLSRATALKFEAMGSRLFVYRPLVDWTAADVFTYCASRSLQPNPLYKQGMNRVGCMPCINVNKAELKQIAVRFVEHIERIWTWEQLVGRASKRQATTFIPAPGKNIKNDRAYAQENDIWHVVEWSRTTRGGKQFSLLEVLDEPTACASSYGLCE